MITKDRIFGLDFIRAFATILVIASHGALLFPGYNNLVTDALQLLGVFGVEMFYVLSGFLIGGILLKLLDKNSLTIHTVKYFWVRRWFRTLPLYFLILLINIVKSIIFSEALPGQLWKYFFFLQNFNHKQSYFFPESWSLTVEEFSYVFAPLLILVLIKLVRDRAKAFLLASIFAIVFFIGVKLSYYFSNVHNYEDLIIWNASLKGVVVYRLDSIFYGFLMAYLFNKHIRIFKRYKMYMLLFGMVLFFLIYGIMIVTKFQITGVKFFWNVLYLPLNSIAIASCLPFIYYLSKPNVMLKNLIQNISMYSYSIYLIHYSLILSFMVKYLPLNSFSIIQKWALLLLYTILSYLLSSYMYKYFEKPMMDLRDKPIFKKP
ncbi:acyltransferase family protein [Pseudofulvibacter geojedonensis]|uniref:Acyltransferase family protein n=1 Tax=Pseudofulvibacter geojedonensis TaxID=1123758 RepID=A0ABW3I3D5_9FLAO